MHSRTRTAGRKQTRQKHMVVNKRFGLERVTPKIESLSGDFCFDVNWVIKISVNKIFSNGFLPRLVHVSV